MFKNMPDVTKLGLEEETKIPPGDEHNRCREALANEGAGVNIPDDDCLTPLLFAVKETHTQCVNELIKAGADVNVSDKYGETPLMSAFMSSVVRGASVNLLPVLLQAGADVNQCNKQSQTILIIAAKVNRAEDMKTILEAGADVNHRDDTGQTALMISTYNYDTRGVNILLAAGADVNIRDNNGEDALFSASLRLNYDLIKRLLDAGADTNNMITGGNSALLAAMNAGNYAEDPEREFEMHHVNSVNALINAGANVNVEDTIGMTALCYAAWWGHVKCMKSLLKVGADVNVIDNDGRTPLIVASYSGYYKCIDVLLKAEAHVNNKNKVGETALILAARFGHYKCIDLLLNAGADVNATNNYGTNALHVTQEGNYAGHLLSCIKRLLRAGIHINMFSKSKDKNALAKICETNINMKEAAMMLLHAAGETLEDAGADTIPEELKFEVEKLQLKHICREAIRKHLLKLDPHQHLFGRIPCLGLPSSMNDYLLFNMSLDDMDDDHDEEGGMSLLNFNIDKYIRHGEYV